MITFLKGSIRELKHVVWPTRYYLVYIYLLLILFFLR